jgi:hypothetical protein
MIAILCSISIAIKTDQCTQICQYFVDHLNANTLDNISATKQIHSIAACLSKYNDCDESEQRIIDGIRYIHHIISSEQNSLNEEILTQIDHIFDYASGNENDFSRQMLSLSRPIDQDWDEFDDSSKESDSDDQSYYSSSDGGYQLDAEYDADLEDAEFEENTLEDNSPDTSLSNNAQQNPVAFLEHLEADNNPSNISADWVDVDQNNNLDDDSWLLINDEQMVLGNDNWIHIYQGSHSSDDSDWIQI